MAVLVVFYKFVDLPAKNQPVRSVKKSAAEMPLPVEIPKEVLTSKSPVSEGQDVVVETGRYRIIFTTCGAGIKSFRLKEYAEIWKSEKELKNEMNGISKKLSANRSRMSKIQTQILNEYDIEKIDALKKKQVDLEKEEKFLLSERESFFYAGEESRKRQLRVKELVKELEQAKLNNSYKRAGILENELEVERGTELVPPAAQVHGDYPLALSLPGLEDVNWRQFSCDTKKVCLTGNEEIATVEFAGEAKEGIKVKEIFTFSSENYIIGLDVLVENTSSGEFREENAMLTYGPGVGFVKMVQVRGASKEVASYLKGRTKVTFEKLAGMRATVPSGTSVIRSGDFEWVALRSKYFAAVLIPSGGCEAIKLENLAGGGENIGVKIPSFSIQRDGTFRTGFKIYIGPQKPEELKKAGESLGKIIDLGFWQPIAKVLDFLLKMFFRIVGNYGWAIVLLSLSVKIVFYPLTHRSFEGMRKMQEDMKQLEPKIKALKEKYANNQQKINKETMALYRREGVNPMSGCKGCFPMLLQMPVFFALYAVLYNSIDLRDAHFIGWIHDLSAADPFYVLPILMGISMFWQQKQTGMGTSPTQQEQQKMMSWMMPIFLTFIFFRLPAGVVLYWFSFNIFTSLQQLLIKRKQSGSAPS